MVVKLDRGAVHGRGPPLRVEAERTGAQHPLGGRGRHRPAQHRPHPGDQLARAERLGHVVVGAELQAEHPVDLVVPGGDEQHRGPVRRPRASAGRPRSRTSRAARRRGAPRPVDAGPARPGPRPRPRPPRRRSRPAAGRRGSGRRSVARPPPPAPAGHRSPPHRAARRAAAGEPEVRVRPADPGGRFVAKGANPPGPQPLPNARIRLTCPPGDGGNNQVLPPRVAARAVWRCHDPRGRLRACLTSPGW